MARRVGVGEGEGMEQDWQAHGYALHGIDAAMTKQPAGGMCEHPEALVPGCGGEMDTYCSHWTRNTLIGSALFGVGWGLGGVCPGPAIAGLGAGNVSMLWPLGGILLGALLQGLVAGRKM